MGKFEIYRRADGDYGWRLRATNNEIVATGEGYATKAGAREGIADVKRLAPSAPVQELA